MKERVKRKPTTWQALLPIIFMFVVLGVGRGLMGLQTEPLILIATIVAGGMAYYLGYSWKEMQDAMGRPCQQCLFCGPLAFWLPV